MLKYLAIFSIVCVSVLSQTCNFDSYHQCLSKDLKQDAKKQQLDDCFSSSGCKIQPNSHQATNTTLKPGTLGSFQTCMDSLRKDIRTTVEKCVQGNYSDFALTKEETDTVKNGHYMPHSPQKEMMDEMLNKSCPNTDSIRKAKLCLNPVKNGTINLSSTHQMPPWMELCEKKKNCSASLTPDCQKKLRSVNALLCQCTKHELTNQRRNYWQRQWQMCRKGADVSPKPTGEVHGREAYGQVWMAIREFCKVDRCD